MFEQSVIGDNKGPWTMAASLTLQCVVVAAVALWSLLHIEALGPIRVPTPLPPFPRMSAVEVVDVQRSSAPGPSAVIPAQRHVFKAPTQIRPADPALASVEEAPSTGAFEGRPGMLDGVMSRLADMANNLTRGVLPAMSTSAAPPPPAPERPAGPRPIGGDVLEARILKRVIPEYPALARQARISGIVHLVGIIGRDGLVKSLNVIGGHPILVKAALEAVQQWRYCPTLLNGQPVDVTAPISVYFTLQ
jgi:protein TonB